MPEITVPRMTCLWACMFLTWLATGCVSTEQQCTQDSDCAPGQECIDGLCGGTGSPSIAISPMKFVFIADESGPNPVAQALDITNAGNGTIQWSANTDAAWLAVTPATGDVTTETDTLVVNADITGLTVGRQAGTVTISDGSNSQEVHVTLFVMPGSGSTPVFVSFVSHNEDDARYEMYDTQSGYEGMREAILSIMDVVQAYDIPFDYQTDWRFLRAVQKWETPALMATTNDKSILRYLKEDLGISVEPHSHECATASAAALANNPEFADGCNYADVACLIESLGVTPGPVVGGFIVNPPEDADWERFRSALQGVVYPDCSWQAETLWGGGSSQHVDDPLLSGVWHPMDHDNYAVDDPAQNLPSIGNGGGLVRFLIQDIETGQAPAGKIYTHTFTVFELNVYQQGDSALSVFENQLTQLQPYLDDGRVIFATLPEVLEIWRIVYGSEPNVYDRSIP